ncbi:NADH-quinone oxidoreductase subunit J [Alcaligenes sp. SDU_A2]|uniref:NADH-quinone oxidoreductase subunit J n=1 Tax=Alcaligenes sp. SDU_A2 TaxID=3136634 RepID=UPI002CA4E846|nr:NADH-quinone oxidoreductase subunit J [Alcaligenes sp.]HRL26943.1 NADH-quinone oxidoreductase subunit J [Alcaligenes sp.]
MLFTTVLFYVLALVLVVAAFRVISASNPVTAVLHLILVFFTAAMLWMLMGAEFLSLLLVVVYVGAVMVMFLFVIMMLDVRQEAGGSKFKAYIPLGLLIGAIMVLEMGFVLTQLWLNTGPAAVMPDDYNNTQVIGELMYSQYVLAVLVGGIVLLVGMVSAIALTLRKREGVKRTVSGQQVKVRAQDRLRMVSIPSQTEKPSVSSSADAVVSGDK